jgi:hypothetical protein
VGVAINARDARPLKGQPEGALLDAGRARALCG